MEDEGRLQLGRNPDWMSRLPEELLDVPLWNLAIPGKTEKPGRSRVKWDNGGKWSTIKV